MIKHSAYINALVQRTIQDNIPIEEMEYPGGPLYSNVSGSKNAFASVAAQTVIGDELDKFTFNMDTGNPVDAMEQRLETYQSMGKLILASTPAIASESLISKEFLSRSQGEWMVPCPHCDAEWLMTAEQIYDDKLWHRSTNKAMEHLHYCGARVSERDRLRVLEQGYFHEFAPNISHKILPFRAHSVASVKSG